MKIIRSIVKIVSIRNYVFRKFVIQILEKYLKLEIIFCNDGRKKFYDPNIIIKICNTKMVNVKDSISFNFISRQRIFISITTRA